METTSPSDILQKTKDLASKEKQDAKIFQIKGSVNGAVTGLAAGLMIGYFKKYNLYLSAVGGMLIGSVISYVVLRDNAANKYINKQKS